MTVGLSLVGMAVAAASHFSRWPARLTQEVIDLAVLLNAPAPCAAELSRPDACRPRGAAADWIVLDLPHFD